MPQQCIQALAQELRTVKQLAERTAKALEELQDDRVSQ